LAAFVVRKAVGPTREGLGFFQHWLPVTDPGEFGPEIAQRLARLNLDSVKARYPGSVSEEGGLDLPGPAFVESEVEYILACRAASRRRWDNSQHDPLTMLSACQGFEYQSCEVEGWERTEGAAWLNQIRKELIQCLPGYDGADGWSLIPQRPEGTGWEKELREIEEERERQEAPRLQLV